MTRWPLPRGRCAHCGANVGVFASGRPAWHRERRVRPAGVGAAKPLIYISDADCVGAEMLAEPLEIN